MLAVVWSSQRFFVYMEVRLCWKGKSPGSKSTEDADATRPLLVILRAYIVCRDCVSYQMFVYLRTLLGHAANQQTLSWLKTPSDRANTAHVGISMYTIGYRCNLIGIEVFRVRTNHSCICWRIFRQRWPVHCWPGSQLSSNVDHWVARAEIRNVSQSPINPFTGWVLQWMPHVRGTPIASFV